MKNLIEFLSDFMNAYTLIDVVLILFFAILAIVFFKRLKSALKNLKDYQFYNTVSAQTIEDYDNQIKLQENKITDLKSAFEDAVAEITELRSKAKVSEDELRIAYERIEALTHGNKVFIDKMHDHIKQITYWKERALHQKHTKKVVNSDWWKCIKEIDGYFNEGQSYKQDNSFNDNLFRLFINENHLHSYLVNKSDFKSVTI